MSRFPRLPRPTVLLCAVLVAGCGSAHHAAPTVAAEIHGTTITFADVARYVAYSRRFYAWAYGTEPASPRASCTSPDAPRCAAPWAQALRRLIEETVVAQYARSHAIRLTSRDQARIDAAARDLTAPDSTTAELFHGAGLGPAFVRNLLEREALVRRVEVRVAPPSTRRGPSLLIRRVTFPYQPGRESPVRKAALGFVTDPSSAPAGTFEKEEWVAPFRLPARVRSVLSAAAPGDAAGPFRIHAGFAVYVLLRKAVRHYGKPARQLLERDYFTRWLARQVAFARPICYQMSGARTPCPRAGH